MRRLLKSGWSRACVASVACLAGAALSACDAGSEAAFIRGRNYDPCIQVLPACPGQYAACVLDEDSYTRRDFPGALRFLVRADPEAEIEVLIYLSQQVSPGIDTTIFWNEPGCSDYEKYESEGIDLFAEAEETSIISKSETVYEGGEHLIEILTDMQARTVVSVNVHEPEDQ